MFDLTTFNPSPASIFRSAFRDLDDFERSFFGGRFTPDFRTDIRDMGDAYMLEADLPGMKKEDIHVDIDGNRLTISAERSIVNEDKGDGYIRCERSYGSFSRGFDISGIQAENIGAAYEDGVLKLTLPKKANVQTGNRRLEIK